MDWSDWLSFRYWGRGPYSGFSHFLFPSLKSCCFWSLNCSAKGRGKLKGKGSISWKVLATLSSELAVYHTCRYWFFCRYLNNEVSIIKSPICSSLLSQLFITPHQGLGSYNETSIISLNRIIHSSLYHLEQDLKLLKGHLIILQSKKLVCN